MVLLLFPLMFLISQVRRDFATYKSGARRMDGSTKWTLLLKNFAMTSATIYSSVVGFCLSEVGVITLNSGIRLLYIDLYIKARGEFGVFGKLWNDFVSL